MSQLNAQFVKQGFWVDNTRGPVMGQTITATTKTGNLIVALMAVLTTLGTSHLWNLVVFGYHQMRVNSRPRDGLQTQQQALMRTLPAPATMLTDWLKLWWVWRKRVSRALVRSLPLMLLAIIFAAITIVVGIFSSYLVNSSNIAVLVQSPYCGPVDFLGDDVESSAQADYSVWSYDYMEQVADLADSYTKDCYTNRTTVPERCRIFVRPTLPFQQQRTSCPFEASMCRNFSEPGLTIDTGLIDLADYFGLNLANEDKTKFRRRTTCAVLELGNHHDVVNASDIPAIEKILGGAPWVGEQVMRIYLGETVVNYTFGVGYMPTERDSYAKTHLAYDYSSPYWRKLGGTFKPIPELRNNNSDLVVVFVVTRGTRYRKKVDDPLYSAHRLIQQLNTGNKTSISYMTDAPASAFACQYQYQFCFTQSGQGDKCTDLQGLPSSLEFPGANEAQRALLRLLVMIVFMNSAEGGADHLTPARLVTGFNQALPSDQWLRDMVTLETNIGAQMQIALSLYAMGFSTIDLEATKPMLKNQTDAEKSLCSLQRMQSPGGFVNINVFALAFVITFCAIVTILDLVLLKFLIFWHKFRDILAPRIDAWIQDGTFQLQRRAYEAYGEGIWDRLDREVPTTTKDTELATLPLESRPFCKCTPSSPLEDSPLSTTTTVVSQPRPGEKTSQAEISPMIEQREPGGAI